MRSYDFVILGGGVSGLGFAKRMSEAGYTVLILEKEKVIGGLSRSIFHQGFYLDFCAHRFHTNNKELLKEIQALKGFKMDKHVKKSRIYMFGKYLKYPFELESLLRAMPIWQSLICGISFLGRTFLIRTFRPKPVLRSYKDWFVYLYGKQLYNVMCYPYTSKIWHVDPAELSAEWADQRFKTDDLLKLTKRILKKIITLNFRSYDLEEDSLAPDGGMFYYPQKGIQELSDALARSVTDKGGEIICSATIQSVTRTTNEVIFTDGGISRTVNYKKIISTIPIHEFYKLQELKDVKAEQALDGLKYMDIVFVYLFLNKPQISNDHWLYFPDTDIIFNRAVEFSNWSPNMCPPGKTSICFDITTFEDRPEWTMTDKELVDRVISDSVRIGYLDGLNIDSHLVVRVKNAYPFYDLEFREKLSEIVRFLENEDTFLLGRTGIFRYNNSDNSIEMGFELADKLLSNQSKPSIFQYAVKEISY